MQTPHANRAVERRSDCGRVTRRVQQQVGDSARVAMERVDPTTLDIPHLHCKCQQCVTVSVRPVSLHYIVINVSASHQCHCIVSVINVSVSLLCQCQQCVNVTPVSLYCQCHQCVSVPLLSALAMHCQH